MTPYPKYKDSGIPWLADIAADITEIENKLKGKLEDILS